MHRVFRAARFGVVLALLSPACDETLPAPLDSATPAARLEVRPTNTTCVAEDLPTGLVKLEPVYEGFESPLRYVERRDKGLAYVAEMPGRIKVIDLATKAVNVAVDLVGEVVDFEGQGLFGLAIHPTKPFAYVIVDRKPDAKTLKDLPYRSEVIRFTLSADGKTFDKATEKLILRVDRLNAIHTVDTIEFGPDGLLYVSAGDGGRPDKFHPVDQLPGSLLRIDVDKGDPYGIPDTNPFAKGGGRPEVFAWGFRNPWRFTFDSLTGDIWLGDVGENSFEEIDKVEIGKNYGWPVFEGTQCTKRDPSCPSAGLVAPYYAYPHSQGSSVTGGYVYRGKAIPALAGKYVYADFTAGRLNAIDAVKDPKAAWINPGGPRPMVAGLAEDPDRELWALGWSDGKLYRLVKGDDQPRPVFPQQLSKTGCVDPADPTKPSSGLVPYAVNNGLWSDGADKRRFLALPEGAKLHATSEGHFDLPKGGVAVKEFVLGGKRIETRILRHHPDDSWSGSSYEWNDAQTDATLLDDQKEKPLPSGQTWFFPSPIQCFECHKEAAGTTLGTEALQLNRDFEYAPGQRTNQLTTLADIGYVDARLEPGKTPRLSPLDSAAPAEDRARGYLHSNCSYCHREGGGTGVDMELRYGMPFAKMNVCDKLAGNAGGRGTIRIAPGKPDQSVLFLRMTSRGSVGYGPMPPLSSNVVDEEAAKVLSSWIGGITKCE
ncbi:MAG: PQQ-dependent sugar dehydrogenase [Deltaproteobacteria bacterium]|nr:PQQ-dependent sugar dehydrogenase [Deltaproteobacteria bacterium]